MNPDEEIIYSKNQYKKFIKDVVSGTLERKELIEETITSYLGEDIKLEKTDKLLKIILFAGVFELLFKHNTPKNVVINEYVSASEFFLERSQIKYVNAILDKLSKCILRSLYSPSSFMLKGFWRCIYYWPGCHARISALRRSTFVRRLRTW